jgi:hypothetical protein
LGFVVLGLASTIANKISYCCVGEKKTKTKTKQKKQGDCGVLEASASN